jgi:hypothetical protein
VPVTVIVYVPAPVPAPTATVIDDEPPAATDPGLKVTVVPVGCPLALNATDCGEPLVTAVAIVELPFAPCAIDRLLGLALIEKSETPAVTVSDTDVECVVLGLVPVTVIGYVPGGVLVPAATVIVDEPPAVTDVGLKLAVAPDGSPLELNVTVSAEPRTTAVLIVDVPLAPCTTDKLVGFALIEKSDATGAVTVNVTDVVCVVLAPAPVTVTV